MKRPLLFYTFVVVAGLLIAALATLYNTALSTRSIGITSTQTVVCQDPPLALSPGQNLQLHCRATVPLEIRLRTSQGTITLGAVPAQAAMSTTLFHVPCTAAGSARVLIEDSSGLLLQTAPVTLLAPDRGACAL